MESPEPTAQSLKHLVARNRMNFPALDLPGTTLDLDTPCLFDMSLRRSVERFDEGESELRPFSFRELGGLFLEVSKRIRHTTPR
jgi:hypothetical protein